MLKTESLLILQKDLRSTENLQRDLEDARDEILRLEEENTALRNEVSRLEHAIDRIKRTLSSIIVSH